MKHLGQEQQWLPLLLRRQHQFLGRHPFFDVGVVDPLEDAWPGPLALDQHQMLHFAAVAGLIPHRLRWHDVEVGREFLPQMQILVAYEVVTEGQE